MHNYSEIRAQVTKKMDVLIRANQPDIDLNTPIYAINWFSTKIEWLYHFYNLLASRSLIKVKGRALFKGKVTETLIDDHQGRRDLLLIVRYPSGQNFKELMQSTYFKTVSIFRIMSVKKFTFGFTHKIAVETKSRKSDKLHYAIHHFKVDQEAPQVLHEIQTSTPDNISIKYGGHIIADLLSQKKDKEPRQVPNLMDAIVIYQSQSEDELRSYLKSESYQGILEKLPSNHISLLNRII